MLFRLIFLVAAAAAISGTAYVSYYGYGGQSRDLDRSVRIASPGAGGVAARVK